jgi:multiple antibiotic resistance protein
MGPVEFAINVFIALFALIDPVGMVPLFAAATTGAPAPAQRRIALYVALFTFAFMSVFFLTGLGILKFFGISMAAFRIAGGLMLLLMGLNMARDDFSTMFHEVAAETGQALDVGAYARRRFENLIVPFGMPLLVGPGAISAAVIYAGEAKPLGWAGYAAGVAGIAGVALTTFLAFAASRLIERVLGKIGMTIVVRVLGLILTAMAVQFIIVGVSAATQGFVTTSAAVPYPVTVKHHR